MASNIDPSNIDENYPVAGIDNNSRGFRDNFASIKNALITAKNELTSIQNSQVQSLMDLGIDDGEAGSILTANGDGTFQFENPEDPVLVVVLEDLSNVTIDNVSNNQILKYDADTEQWVNSDNVVVANVEDLSNVTIDNVSNNQILKYDADTEQWVNANSIVDIGSFTTDELAEGDNNLYLTKERYDEFFSEAYSKNTGDLLAINLPNSIEAAASNILPNTIQISNINFIQSFKDGDNVRIFGASSEQSYLTSPGVIVSVLANGFSEPVDNTYTFGYRICQFNTSTGKISPASDESSVSEIDIENFNLTNNITIRISRSSQENGILIYRKLTGPQSTATYNLIAVLGEKEFEGSLSFSFVDYYTFDNTEWSGKNAIRNEFTSSSGVVHFPLTAPAVPKYGWVDAEIQTVNYDTGSIVLTENYFLESSLIVSNNDTEFLQDKINSAVELNINSLILAPKTYIVSNLSIPTNFTLLGRGSITKLKKLSWSSKDNVNIVTSNVNTTQVTLADMFIDGNMQNQYLKNDSVTQLVNYAVSILGSKNKITNLTIDNVIGGGIFSKDTQELFITFNKITNGSLTDRYESAPIIASGSTEITISNNFIKNFPSALDVSIVDTGILSGNTVSNCGSGILTFGSTKLVSSPNLVLGPAGEYLPGPDIFN
jgi:hypothetical protein